MLIIQSTGKVSQKSEIVDRDPRFSGKVNEKKTHVHLEISTAKVTDSAMYYCAMEPTVTGNTRTLYKNPLNSNTVQNAEDNILGIDNTSTTPPQHPTGIPDSNHGVGTNAERYTSSSSADSLS
ncbi:unnamed protein product [Leuciscus chuanchicus]